ncbi:MAG TPA: hypothetical protein ENK44_15825 [Caldithrix abyssi]|uniref:Uncharacterized protein n=1 Tax=Caldithrix abyssi TaxID=187145 RepID=A0A7V4U4D3_CALAY|nr:hypothetical protein [Caldithrix abyssi]
MSEPCIEGQVGRVDENQFEVRFADEEGCASCGIKHLCTDKQIVLDRTLVKGEIKTGQKIRIEYRKVFQTALIVYLLPLLFFFGGIVLAKIAWGSQNEPLQFVTAFAALGLGLLALNRLNNLLSKKKYKIDVKIVEK